MQTCELSCQARRSPPTSSLQRKQAPCPPATQAAPIQKRRGVEQAHSMHLEHLERPSSAAVVAQRGCGSR